MLQCPRLPRLFARYSFRGFKVGKSPRRDEIFQVPIEGMDKAGKGTVLLEWDTIQKQIEPTLVSVRGALLGETVRIRVISVFRLSSAMHTVRVVVFGRQEHLIRPQKDNQPWRSSVEPSLLPAGHTESEFLVPFSCPHFDRRNDSESCSQCTVPHLHYSRQIIEKTRLLRTALSGAVDSLVLSKLAIEPKSIKITRYAKTFSLLCFPKDKRPLGEPDWGQASFKKSLPGERIWTNMIATDHCVKISKSSQAVLNRMKALIALEHSNSSSKHWFSPFDVKTDLGFLQSAQINCVENKAGNEEILLTIVGSKKISNEKPYADIANRLLAEFPLLKGVVLNASNNEDEVPILLAGQPFVNEYIQSIDREVRVGSSGLSNVCSETMMPEVLREINEGKIFFLGDQSLSDLLEGFSPVKLIASEFDESKDVIEAPPGEVELSRNSAMTCLVAFPKNEEKGVTSKKFRHWLGNVLKPSRVVMVTDQWDKLRKDIGHLKLLGYELIKIRAADSSPGNMDGITVFVVMEKNHPAAYEPLRSDQIEIA